LILLSSCRTEIKHVQQGILCDVGANDGEICFY
jgi:hypothetical protein